MSEGASVPDQALAATPSSPDGLDPSGFDPSRGDKPVRSIEAEFRISADSWPEFRHVLRKMEEDIVRHRRLRNVFSGGYASCHGVSVIEDASITHDVWAANLQAYCDYLDARDSDGSPKGEDAQAASFTTARAEGIAQGSSATTSKDSHNDEDRARPVVTQADREAAASLVEWHNRVASEWETANGGTLQFFTSDLPEGIRKGGWDDHDFVQGFANHRTTAEQQARETERAACAEVASKYAEVNFEMAGDTVLLDPCLSGEGFSDANMKLSEKLMQNGLIHASQAHAGQHISAAILQRQDNEQ